MARVSIVLRTKNRPVFLRRALADISGQTLTDFELIIVNDGGDVDTFTRVVEEYPALADRMKVIHEPVATGRDQAWRTGVANTSADYFVIHDDDDTWDPDFLAETVAFLDSHPHHGAVATSLEVVAEKYENDTFVELYRWVYHKDTPFISLGQLLRANRTVPIATLYRKDKAVPAMPDEDLPVVEDWMVNLNIALEGPFGFIVGKPLAFWHQRPETEDADCGNSVVVDAAEHQRIDADIRDHYLREYIDHEGLGLVLHISGLHEHLSVKADNILRTVQAIEQRLARLEEESRTMVEKQNEANLVFDEVGRELRSNVGLTTRLLRKYRQVRSKF